MKPTLLFSSTLLVALCSHLLLTGAPIRAQELDGKGIAMPGSQEVAYMLPNEEDLAEFYGPESMALSTVGDTITTAGHQACWASYDSYRDRWRLPVGDAYGRYVSIGRSPTADAYYDSADCGDGVEAGAIDHGDDLEFFITSAYAIDAVSTDGGRIYFQLRLEKYCSAGCAQGCTDATDKIDQAYCSSTTTGTTWREALDLEGDGDVCHRPDIVLTSTSSWYPRYTGIQGYEYRIIAYVCDDDGTNCTAASDSGCVDIDFK